MKLLRYFLIFVFGAAAYGFIEILFRGFTHWSMVLTGGACLLTLYFANKAFPRLPISIKAVLGAAIITLYELAVGLIVNVWFDLGVWDYSMHPYSFYGQICPLFSFFWFVICFILASIWFIFSRIVKKY